MKKGWILLAALLLAGCGSGETTVLPTPSAIVATPTPTLSPFQTYVDVRGTTVETRFRVPEGAVREKVEAGSFGAYLRALSVKDNGTMIYQHDGEAYPYQDDHAAILSLEIGTQDRMQVGDTLVRLHAEYCFASADYDAVSYHLTSGFLFRYSQWREGYRLKVENNSQASMHKEAQPDDSYRGFLNYLNRLYAYVTTRSLLMDVEEVALSDIQIGDMVLEAGRPGWGAMVVDLCRKGDEVYVMLAQGGFPEQDVHIIKNQNNPELYVWYKLSDCTDGFSTPRYQFEATKLVRFRDTIED